MRLKWKTNETISWCDHFDQFSEKAFGGIFPCFFYEKSNGIELNRTNCVELLWNWITLLKRSNFTWNKMNFPRNFEFNLINVWLWHNLFDGLANWTILLFHTNGVWVCIATKTMHVSVIQQWYQLKCLVTPYSRLINVIQANIVQVNRKLCREYVDNGQMSAMMW